jgi:hypothetical protein
MLAGMAMGHAGELGFEWAVKEGGVAGAVGALVGAIAGWPHQHLHAVGATTLHTSTWSNAFTSGAEFAHVVEAGLFGGAVIAVLFGVAGAALFGKKNAA